MENTKSLDRQQEINKLLTELAQCQAVLQIRREKPPVVTTVNAAFKKFQRAYRNDPVAFVWDNIEFRDGEGPNHYQEEILSSLIKYHRVAEYGPRGIGKTTVGSWAVWWAILTVEDVKVPTTASAWRQLQKYLWPEIHKWYLRLKWDKIGIAPLSRNRQLKSTEIELSKTALAFAVASNDYNKIEGAHAADRVFCVFDESKAVPDSTFNSMEGAFSMTRQPLALAMSTPGAKLGRFYDICMGREGYEDWHVIHVTMEDAIRAGRMNPLWAEQRKKQWGQDSAIYRNHVLGEFASDSERTVIPLYYVELAQARWDYIMKESGPGPITAIGIDPARGGGDPTVVATAAGKTIVDIIEYDFDDTMKIVEAVSPLIMANPLAHVVIDVIGVGAGVYDRLRQIFGDRIVSFNAAEKTETRDRSGQLRFRNKRSWAWWAMREALDPGYQSTVALPPDDELVGELTTPRYEDKFGIMQIESKDDIRASLSRSTNKADAVINAIVGVEMCTSSTTEILSYLDYIREYGEVAYA